LKYLLFALYLSVAPISHSAQHCPFDGGNMITVYAVDTNGRPARPTDAKLSLVEIGNPEPASCTYADEHFSKNFRPTKQLVQSDYADHWKTWIEPRYREWTSFDHGYSSVILNQADYNCMIRLNDDFNYRRRKFEIRYRDADGTHRVEVPPERIYSLCTHLGPWTRIIPLKIVVRRKARS
jgi:hypothetical protein